MNDLKGLGAVAYGHPVGTDNDSGAGPAEAEIPGKVSKALGIEVTEIAAGIFEEWHEELSDTLIVSLLTEGPLDDPRVAEVSIEPGGPLEVFSCGVDTPVLVVPVDEGWVRLRVLWAGLVAGRYEGMNEDGTSDEHVVLQLWGTPQSLPAVVRRWSGWSP